MLTTDGSLPQQLGVVWSRLLEADSEGPSSSLMQLVHDRSVHRKPPFLRLRRTLDAPVGADGAGEGLGVERIWQA